MHHLVRHYSKRRTQRCYTASVCDVRRACAMPSTKTHKMCRQTKLIANKLRFVSYCDSPIEIWDGLRKCFIACDSITEAAAIPNAPNHRNSSMKCVTQNSSSFINYDFCNSFKFQMRNLIIKIITIKLFSVCFSTPCGPSVLSHRSHLPREMQTTL